MSSWRKEPRAPKFVSEFQDFSCDIIDEFINKNVFKQTIRLIRLSENQGPSNARNVGIEASNAEYIALLDSDDYFDYFCLLKTMIILMIYLINLWLLFVRF